MSATPDHSAAIMAMGSDGISASDLALLVGLSPAEVENRLTASEVAPLRGRQQRSRVYDLWQAMGALTRGGGSELTDQQITTAIQKMRPSQLPPALQLEFWKAQQARSAYQLENKQLWRTERVQKLVGGIFKVIRQNMMLLPETANRQTSLTQEQIKIITGMADATLDEIREGIVEEMGAWEGADRESDDPSK